MPLFSRRRPYSSYSATRPISCNDCSRAPVKRSIGTFFLASAQVAHNHETTSSHGYHTVRVPPLRWWRISCFVRARVRCVMARSAGPAGGQHSGGCRALCGGFGNGGGVRLGLGPLRQCGRWPAHRQVSKSCAYPQPRTTESYVVGTTK